MIKARFSEAPGVLLLGPVRGLTSEVPRVLGELDSFAPARVGIGLSPTELEALREYFVEAEAEPVVPLTENERSEVRGLVRFGEVRVPNPSFVEVLRWSEARGVPAVGLDPDDEQTAALFAEHIGYIELVRRTVRERRVSRSPPTPSSPDEYALEWDREVSSGRGSRAFARARDAYLVRQIPALTAGHEPLAVVVDRERFASVRELLAQGPPPEPA
ncbi:MAG TPA: hypothetical protein VEH28_08865 [Thermoplasmata archaeon]|nr:hypothetical protein [Thermoplasmata archaeon]